MNQDQRDYQYRIGTAIVPLLIYTGALSDVTAPLWLALLAAILSAVPYIVALRHTPCWTARRSIRLTTTRAAQATAAAW